LAPKSREAAILQLFWQSPCQCLKGIDFRGCGWLLASQRTRFALVSAPVARSVKSHIWVAIYARAVLVKRRLFIAVVIMIIVDLKSTTW
jgi:hypothetical protein